MSALSTASGQSNDTPSSTTESNKVARVSASAQHHSEGEPLDHGTLLSTMDYLAIRYKASAGDAAIADSNKRYQVVEAVSSRLKEAVALKLPVRADADLDFYFNFDQEFVASQRSPIIDIICNTPAVLEIVRDNLSAIEVEDEHIHERVIIYKAQRLNGLMPQDLLAVSAMRPSPIGASDLDAWIHAWGHAVLPLGHLSPPMHFVLIGKTSYVHAYIKLSSMALALSYEEFLERRPTLAHWFRGNTWIRYQDRHLRCYHDYALRNPASCEGPSRRPLVGPVGEIYLSGSHIEPPHLTANLTGKRKHGSSE